MEIAKATAEKILEILSDDDFFNVIKVRVYNINELSPCYKRIYQMRCLKTFATVEQYI
jgi:hypothetical protein